MKLKLANLAATRVSKEKRVTQSEHLPIDVSSFYVLIVIARIDAVSKTRSMITLRDSFFNELNFKLCFLRGLVGLVGGLYQE